MNKFLLHEFVTTDWLHRALAKESLAPVVWADPGALRRVDSRSWLRTGEWNPIRTKRPAICIPEPGGGAVALLFLSRTSFEGMPPVPVNAKHGHEATWLREMSYLARGPQVFLACLRELNELASRHIVRRWAGAFVDMDEAFRLLSIHPDGAAELARAAEVN